MTVRTGPRPVQRVTLIGRDSTTFIFDATTDETYSHESEITEHPVEDGVNVSDHQKDKPKRVSFELVMSNTPIVEGVFDLDTPVDPFQQFYNDIIDFRSKRIPVVIITGALLSTAPVINPELSQVNNIAAGVATFVSDQLDNFLIENITLKRTSRTGDAGDFSITLKQIKVAQSQVVPTPAAGTKVGKTDKGSKQTKPASDADDDKATVIEEVSRQAIGKQQPVDGAD